MDARAINALIQNDEIAALYKCFDTDLARVLSIDYDDLSFWDRREIFDTILVYIEWYRISHTDLILYLRLIEKYNEHTPFIHPYYIKQTAQYYITNGIIFGGARCIVFVYNLIKTESWCASIKLLQNDRFIVLVNDMFKADTERFYNFAIGTHNGTDRSVFPDKCYIILREFKRRIAYLREVRAILNELMSADIANDVIALVIGAE